MSLRRWLGGAAVMLALLFYLWSFFRIDACLDQGGRWNSDRGLCEKAGFER